MKLYDIEIELQELLEKAVDIETGELKDEIAWSELQAMLSKKKEKIEKIAFEFKNQKAFLEALKNEKKAIDRKIKSTERSMDYLKELIQNVLQGEKFKTPLVSIYEMKRKSVEIDEEYFYDYYLKERPEIVKTEVIHKTDKKRLLKMIEAGEELEFTEVKESKSLVIR